MRNMWDEDPKYITDLAVWLIGQRSLDIIVRDNVARNPIRIRSHVAAIIIPKLEKMNAETLGLICAYATSSGAHSGRHARGIRAPRFINCTGLDKVLPKEMRDLMLRDFRPGELLVEIALSVIVCVVVDSIQQIRLQALWHTWDMTEEEEKAIEAQNS